MVAEEVVGVGVVLHGRTRGVVEVAAAVTVVTTAAAAEAAAGSADECAEALPHGARCGRWVILR